MLTVKDTIPIVFNAGTYGTYLEWLLTTLTTDSPIIEPFRSSTGSSHNFSGNHLLDITGWHNYVNSNKTPTQFVRFHPKVKETESITENLKNILNTVDRIIYLYPDPDSFLLTINNNHAKVDNWWERMFNDEVSPDVIYNNWFVDPTLPVNQIPFWIKREFLSYYLMPSWFSRLEWFHPSAWQHNRCQIIYTIDLLDNIEQVLENIKSFTGVTFDKPIKDILPVHKKMLQLQKYRNQDWLCSSIIKSIENNTDFDWANQELPLASQSYLQWKLRELGYEIECNALDLFPTNSINLRSILYPSNQNS